MAMGDPWSDPFSATMGRVGEIPVISRFLPNLTQQYKETAMLLSIVFGVLAVLLFFYYAEAAAAQHDTYWAEQPWSPSSCTVQSAGVAYRGNCQLDTDLLITSYSDFAECLGPADEGDVQAVRRQWLQSEPGHCALMGNHDYRVAGAEEGEEPQGAGDGAGDGGDMDVDMMAAGRRLLPIRPNRQNCHNDFLVWAVMVVSNPSALSASPVARCAYQFGASIASVTSDWGIAWDALGRLQAWQDSGQSRPCWQLAGDGCVVAFDDLRGLVAREAAGSHIAGIVAGACALVAAIAGVLAARWHWLDHGCCGVFAPGGFCRLPTHEPGEFDAAAVPLSERVGNIVRSAAARLGEITPGTRSGETSLRAGARDRSRRTVEVVNAVGERVSVPRNVAADFLNGI